MTLRRKILSATAWFGLLTLVVPWGAAAREAILLAPSQGNLPTDTGSDGLTKLAIVDIAELGGKALKIDYHAGDSVGDRITKIENWKPFVALRFDAFNPAAAKVELTLTVKHRRTTSYATRADVPFSLAPGKNRIRLGIDEMVNVNGSLPDLAHVVRWYIACRAGETPTVFLSDLVLEGADEATAVSGVGPAAGPAVPYHIRGTIGDMPVDLVATPLSGPLGSASGKRATRHTDPARLARIRAAQMPAIAAPVMFDTPEADAIVSALEVLPPDSPFYQVVADWPLHPNSEALIASIGADKPLRYNPDMAYILVPPGQPRVEVRVVDYAAQSDPGPYPVPENVPIEGWPAWYARSHQGPQPSLDDVQRDRLGRGGDRHAIVVDPTRRMLYEFFVMKKTDHGWQAAQASVFDLKSSRLRPTGWTSADAAGLPIFPAVVRYDELKRGLVEHAMRVTVRNTRREFVAPATHYASPHTNPDYPRMGERLRMKADFNTSDFSPPVRTILEGLKKYGMFVADNGIEWAISVTPDPRIPSLHDELRKVPGSAFEVVVAPPE